MSRPGFVFDLATTMEFTCRGCGATEQGSGASSVELHLRMKIHVRERHALVNADEWKLTRHERTSGEGVVCFWPPEAV